jgi:hypothetical protein
MGPAPPAGRGLELTRCGRGDLVAAAGGLGLAVSCVLPWFRLELSSSVAALLPAGVSLETTALGAGGWHWLVPLAGLGVVAVAASPAVRGGGTRRPLLPHAQLLGLAAVLATGLGVLAFALRPEGGRWSWTYGADLGLLSCAAVSGGAVLRRLEPEAIPSRPGGLSEVFRGPWRRGAGAVAPDEGASRACLSLSRLGLAERALLLGALVAFVALFLPWYGAWAVLRGGGTAARASASALAAGGWRYLLWVGSLLLAADEVTRAVVVGGRRRRGLPRRVVQTVVAGLAAVAVAAAMAVPPGLAHGLEATGAVARPSPFVPSHVRPAALAPVVHLGLLAGAVVELAAAALVVLAALALRPAAAPAGTPAVGARGAAPPAGGAGEAADTSRLPAWLPDAAGEGAGRERSRTAGGDGAGRAAHPQTGTSSSAR